MTSTGPGADHDAGATPDVGVDAYARSAVGVDGGVGRVDAGGRLVLAPDDREDDRAVGEVDRRDIRVGALLVGKGDEPDAGTAAHVEHVAVGQSHLGAGGFLGLHLVAGRDREVAARLHLAVRG